MASSPVDASAEYDNGDSVVPVKSSDAADAEMLPSADAAAINVILYIFIGSH